MYPTLVYLYIHEIGRCFWQEEFTFTNDFHIKYDYLHRKLSFKKNSNNPYTGLWGNHISNINLIVGKNGSGKSTVLNLLGTKQYQRNHFFNNAQWFAVYHLEGESFIIEGRNPSLLRDVAGGLPEGILDYSVKISYDYDLQQIAFEGEIGSNDSPQKKEKERLIYLYQSKSSERSWFRQIKDLSASDTFRGYQRQYLDKPFVAEIYRFMSVQYKNLEKVFTIDKAVCIIQRPDNIFPDFMMEEEKLEMLGFQFYQGKGKVLFFERNKMPVLPRRKKRQESPWSIKERFIISYLEAIIMNLWLNSLLVELNEEQKQEYIEQINGISYGTDNYSDRIAYLTEFLDVLGGWVNPILKENNGVQFDPLPYNALIIAFKALRDIYFESNAQVVVPVSMGIDENVHQLLIQYDRFIDKYGFRRSLQVSFGHMSSGELEFIHSFVCLYWAINAANNHQQQVDTILLLLDEPDASFHPEWSRRYIHNLTECIRLSDLSENIKFQIIIATHSPFMVSDVPKEHITCINVMDNLKRIVKKADFGLMGNFYDIVKNDFFLDSPVGEFAKSLFQITVKRINDWEEYNEKEIKQVKDLISAIDEPVIRSRLQERIESRVADLTSHWELEEQIVQMEKALIELKNRRRPNRD
ncbi:AAA family ATPase [Paenibacillus amylolyticus]|uniref:AAA family ATPase n=1 Tax=Paenibacillus amylolyticus TaxID=1451 RepID=UPI00201E0B70|nr:AAA family ATPase [Paenibacillus amylolyticus]MCL6663422.1 AAA family ATPase [Paenibacillus amylolyticus]